MRYKSILRYRVLFIFLILQSIAFYFVISHNVYQELKFLSYTTEVSGSFYSKINTFYYYISLKEKNKKLILENTYLKELLINKNNKESIISNFLNDSNKANFLCKSANIVNSNINFINNHLIIDKGYKQGIRKNMGVITHNGIVGVIKETSLNYSSVITILNHKIKTPVKLKKNNFLGILYWEGENTNYVTLSDIPIDININKGDTVVTTGFSSLYPKGYLVGFIESFEKNKGEHFYKIKVKLSVLHRKLDFVYVVEHINKKEIKNIIKKNK